MKKAERNLEMVKAIFVLCAIGAGALLGSPILRLQENILN